jgi:hypothetical protein
MYSNSFVAKRRMRLKRCVYLLVPCCLSLSDCHSAPPQNDDAAQREVVRSSLEAAIGLNVRSKKRLILLRNGLVLPDAAEVQKSALEKLVIAAGDEALDDKGNTAGKWSSVQRKQFTADTLEFPSGANSESSQLPEQQAARDLRDARALVRKAELELAALKEGDARRPLFESRVRAEQAKVDLLLAAHPELKDQGAIGKTAPDSTDLTRIDSFYPPVENWREDSAWMGDVPITVTGALTLEYKNGRSPSDPPADSSTESPSVQAVRLDIKQVQLVRPNYNATKLAQALKDFPGLKGKWIITDIILCRNMKVRKGDDENSATKVQTFLLNLGKGHIVRASLGPLMLAGRYPDSLSAGQFTPSSQGDFLTNNSIQIIGYLCEQIM